MMERMLAPENPYASPTPIADDVVQLPPRFTLTSMTALVGFGVGGGAVLGAMTNAINGAVSPQFFRNVMGWDNSNIWLSAVGQGMLEGSLYGFGYAVLFNLIIGTLSRRRCRFPTALRYAGLVFGLSTICWFLGGAFGVAINEWLPQVSAVRGGGYAWVKYSILGIVRGGLASVFLACAIYALRHRPADLIAARSKVSDPPPPHSS
jgi:hypothetical protein